MRDLYQRNLDDPTVFLDTDADMLFFDPDDEWEDVAMDGIDGVGSDTLSSSTLERFSAFFDSSPAFAPMTPITPNTGVVLRRSVELVASREPSVPYICRQYVKDILQNMKNTKRVHSHTDCIVEHISSLKSALDCLLKEFSCYKKFAPYICIYR